MSLIKHSEIRDPLVFGLHNYMDLLVVQQSSIGDQPEYPFCTYSVTSPYLQLGQPEHYTDVQERSIEHYEQVYSFTIASTDEDEAMDLCLKAVQYFKFYGVQELKDKNIVVVKISNVTARDNMITINYERRYGFDVRVRVASEEVQEVTEVIEAIKF